MSVLMDKQSLLVSTDIGIMQCDVMTMAGYDIEDVVSNRAISQARAVQLLNLGKQVDPTKPVGVRTIPSKWLNNEETLA